MNKNLCLKKLFSKILCFFFIPAVILASCSGPDTESKYTRYKKTYSDLFDTITVVIAFTESEDEFEKYAGLIYDEMLRIHRLSDIYNDYEGIDNLKTVNDNAGIKPVKVDPTLIELLNLAGTAYEKTGGKVNAAMGSVLRIWHDYRKQGTEDPEAARLPTVQELEAAAAHTDFGDVEIDEDAGTVYLRDPEMSLDVGALAKGFAVQSAIDKAKEAGMVSGFINAGGNVSVIGKPLDGRDAWVIGVNNPDSSEGAEPLFDTVGVTDVSLVTSGDYERFYVVGGIAYHHIIDPETLFPANRFRSVTVVAGDSGIADILSTALFILPFEEGLALVENFGAEALWIFPDGSAKMSDGYRAISSNFAG